VGAGGCEFKLGMGAVNLNWNLGAVNGLVAVYKIKASGL